MPLTKKTIIAIAITLILFSSFSGCVLDEWFGGTSISLVSWNVIDDDEFASLNLIFDSTGPTTMKLIGPDSSELDSEYFFKEDETQYAILHLAESRNSVESGLYSVKAYNENNNEVFSKSFSFSGSDLLITDCHQQWWEREVWIGGVSLLELRLVVKNNGDLPEYPYYVKITVDSETTTGLVLPTAVMPGETEYVYCFIYRETEPAEPELTLELLDYGENILASGTFQVNTENFIPIKKFTWKYFAARWVNVPKPTYLYDYYLGLDRINIEDYSLYIFNQYDDQFIDILLDILMFSYTSSHDVEIINYVSSFVQKALKYELDSETNESYEYPRYPVETLFYGKGDCEDLSIITASLLSELGYRVALLRLPNHMAVGVHLDEGELPQYNYYINDYYFLETTVSTPSCGYVPNSYKSSAGLHVYPITSRPLVTHNWKDGHLSIYSINGQANNVKVTLVVKNLGTAIANDIIVKGAFYSNYDQEINAVSVIIPSLEPGMKEEVTIICNVPLTIASWFKTKIYYDNEVVDEHQSVSSFP